MGATFRITQITILRRPAEHPACGVDDMAAIQARREAAGLIRLATDPFEKIRKGVL